MTLGKLVDGLRARGHLVYVLHTAPEEGQGEVKLQSLPLLGYPEVRFGFPKKGKLLKRWQKKRPDALYVATESLLGFSAMKVARRLGIPTIAGFHTNFHHYMKQYHLGKMQNAALAYLRRVHDMANCTLVPSEDVKSMLERDGFNNIKLMGRGVDTTLFSPDKRSAELRMRWGARPSTPVAMVVGRLAPEKNLELAMEAFRMMRQKVPDMQFVVVGGGPMRDRLKQEHRHVHFVGVQQGTALATHYASADILLFPSETETFGNVLLEGMASGMVTVSYNYAAARQHVVDGVNGLVATKGDAFEFLQKAEQAVDLRGLNHLRQRACRDTQKLGWNEITRQFESHLQEVIRQNGRGKQSSKTRKPMNVRTLFLSDLHLGSHDSKAREVVDVLKHTRCEKVVLNGDIIDGWALKRGSKWKKIHTRVVRMLLKKMEKEESEVVYLRGNHDDFLQQFLAMELGRLRCRNEIVHVAADGRKFLVLHGDGFDAVSTDFKWMAVLGSFGYDALLRFNRVYNRYRSWRGKEYYSVSKAIKGRVKSAVNFVGKYEEKLVELAVKRNCDGIICGHIHTPADEVIDGVHYLNSGDWVETLSCVVEHHDGRMEVLYYHDFLERTRKNQDPEIDVIEQKLPEQEWEVSGGLFDRDRIEEDEKMGLFS